MQVKIHELFEHTDTNGDTIKAITIGNMQGVVITIQPKDSEGGVSVALDLDAMTKLSDILEDKGSKLAWDMIRKAQKELEG